MISFSLGVDHARRTMINWATMISFSHHDQMREHLIMVRC